MYRLSLFMEIFPFFDNLAILGLHSVLLPLHILTQSLHLTLLTSYKKISSHMADKFDSQILFTDIYEYTYTHKEKKNYPKQSGLIFISALVAIYWGSRGLYWLQRAHLKPSICLYWPLRLELPQVLLLGYHQAPHFLAQPSSVSFSIVKNEALRL